MKKFLVSIIMGVAGLYFLTGCGSSNTSSNSDLLNFKIGIVQYVEHEALDLARIGFVNELLENGFNMDLIEVQNAQGEQPNCSLIANKFVNDNMDLILGIATPATQAIAQATTNIPILGTSVTDFTSAGLIADNISGTSNMNPIAEQIKLLKEIDPTINTIGVIYCSSEDNSRYQAGIAKVEIEKLGLVYEEFTASDTNEVQQVVQSAVERVDGIYIPTDNLMAQAMSTVALVTTTSKTPVVTGDSGMTKMGGLASYCIDYEKLGAQTARQAIRILLDGEDISTMEVEFAPDDEVFLYINEEMFELMEIEIPESIK